MANYLVYGLGISGLACANWLSKQYKVWVYDDNKKLLNDLFDKNLVANCLNVDRLDEKNLKNIDHIILSPTVRLNNRVLKLAEKLEIKVWGEFEFASQFTSAPIVGITGTNGKTTTVNFLHSIFSFLGKKSHLVGNVGTPLSEVIDDIKPTDIVVAELSNFQLENSSHLSLNQAAILNIAPDHLDKYKNFDEYFLAKQNIIKCANGKVLLNYDDPKLRLLGKNYAQSEFFSLSKLPKNLNGAYFDRGIIYLQKNGKHEKLCSTAEFKFQGEHNLANLLVAVFLAYKSGVEVRDIEKAIPNLTLPRHRLEFVRKVNGVDYYNDSKATNLHAVMSALKNFENKSVVLLLGGSEKGEKLSGLTLPSCVISVVAFGKLGKRIHKVLKGKLCVKWYKHLFDAVGYATKIAPAGSVVLLSPGGASFDEFSSYAERGEYFCELINEI